MRLVDVILMRTPTIKIRQCYHSQKERKKSDRKESGRCKKTESNNWPKSWSTKSWTTNSPWWSGLLKNHLFHAFIFAYEPRAFFTTHLSLLFLFFKIIQTFNYFKILFSSFSFSSIDSWRSATGELEPCYRPLRLCLTLPELAWGRRVSSRFARAAS